MEWRCRKYLDPETSFFNREKESLPACCKKKNSPKEFVLVKWPDRYLQYNARLTYAIFFQFVCTYLAVGILYTCNFNRKCQWRYRLQNLALKKFPFFLFSAVFFSLFNFSVLFCLALLHSSQNDTQTAFILVSRNIQNFCETTLLGFVLHLAKQTISILHCKASLVEQESAAKLYIVITFHH